jgi:hypothetical protein
MPKGCCYICPIANTCVEFFGIGNTPPCVSTDERAVTTTNMPGDEIRIIAESVVSCINDGKYDNAKILAETIIAELSPTIQTDI